MIKLTQGIFDSIPMADYVADPAPEPSLSAGVASTLLERSEQHAYAEHPKLGKPESDDSARSDIGSAAHSMLLGGPEVVAVDAANWMTKAAKEQRDKIRAEGKIPLLAEDFQNCKLMAEIATDKLHELAPGGKAEQTMIWRAEREGIWCRCRPDWIADGWIIDYKTATDANPRTWTRKTLYLGGYDIQAAHNLHAAETLIGHDASRAFAFLTQEIKPPYTCSIVGLGPEAEMLAMERIKLARRKWAKMIRRLNEGKLPEGYNEIYWVEPPAWVRYNHEDQEAMGE